MTCQSAPPGSTTPLSRGPFTVPPVMAMTRRRPRCVSPSSSAGATVTLSAKAKSSAGGGRGIGRGAARLALLRLLRSPGGERGAVAVAPAVLGRRVIACERRRRRRQLDAERAGRFGHGAQVLAHAVDVEADIGRAALERGHQL